jgi:hypothetical protein
LLILCRESWRKIQIMLSLKRSQRKI